MATWRHEACAVQLGAHVACACVLQHRRMCGAAWTHAGAAGAHGLQPGHVKGGGAGHLLEGGGKQLALRRERGDGVGLYLVRDGLGGLLAEGGGGLLG